MNRCDYLDPALCWTGVKETGRGITLSALGYATLTRVKSYHLARLSSRRAGFSPEWAAVFSPPV